MSSKTIVRIKPDLLIDTEELRRQRLAVKMAMNTATDAAFKPLSGVVKLLDELHTQAAIELEKG